MIRAAKRLIENHVPHQALLAGYLPFYGRRRAVAMRRSLERMPLPSLVDLDISTLKNSDTLFILGSGASVNRITADKWDIVAQHDSFGFNLWHLHDFRPTLYTFEAMDLTLPLSVQVAEVFVARAHERPDYASVPKIVTDLEPPRVELLERLPAHFRENLYALQTTGVLARTPVELKRAVGWLNSIGLWDEAAHIRRVFKFVGTLSFLISLAVRMGYRKIVLCGIDLSTPGYFYQDEALYPGFEGFQSSPAGATHATLLPQRMSVGIDVVVHELCRQVLDPRGIELFIEHRGSALHPMLPWVDEQTWATFANEGRR